MDAIWRAAIIELKQAIRLSAIDASGAAFWFVPAIMWSNVHVVTVKPISTWEKQRWKRLRFHPDRLIKLLASISQVLPLAGTCQYPFTAGRFGSTCAGSPCLLMKRLTYRNFTMALLRRQCSLMESYTLGENRTFIRYLDDASPRSYYTSEVQVPQGDSLFYLIHL